ncbi:hypothetical protein AGLY_005718 [Aphis glycines]|uniref:Uncharacterized protein n=1 Tax=Aphis glycines TaxID=307491 RepID=A0A6G0TTJ7_APHGL|nr:hypothetical protein AGLY_005718 [Aphis glycines]
MYYVIIKYYTITSLLAIEIGNNRAAPTATASAIVQKCSPIFINRNIIFVLNRHNNIVSFSYLHTTIGVLCAVHAHQSNLDSLLSSNSLGDDTAKIIQIFTKNKQIVRKLTILITTNQIYNSMTQVSTLDDEVRLNLKRLNDHLQYENYTFYKEYHNSIKGEFFMRFNRDLSKLENFVVKVLYGLIVQYFYYSNFFRYNGMHLLATYILHYKEQKTLTFLKKKNDIFYSFE